MSHEPVLKFWICTLGSSVMPSKSFAPSPVTTASEPAPQWYGRPIWWMVLPATVSGVMRSVTSTLTSIAERGEMMVAHPYGSSPLSSASSGEISQNISGCSSDRYGSHRLMPPAVWCSVSR